MGRQWGIKGAPKGQGSLEFWQRALNLVSAFFLGFSGDFEQGFTGEAFVEVLVIAPPHFLDEVVWEFFEDGHELGYAVPLAPTQPAPEVGGDSFSCNCGLCLVELW